MIILGLVLILAMVGLSLALIWANDSVFQTPATTVDVLGNQLQVTVGQAFLTGAAVGALTLLGLVMLLSGFGRSARRRSSARHQLRDSRQEIRDLQRKNDTAATDLAARRVNDEAADSEGLAIGR